MLRRRFATVALLVVPAVAVFAGDGVAQNPPTCFGQLATKFVGGPGPDRMTGTSGSDVMVGEGGNDIMIGGGGNDLICGNDDQDTIQGGAGDDRIDGGAAADGLTGDSGGDTVNGGGGNDQLDGSDGSDIVNGGDGDDTVDGGNSGDDFDLLSGGPGNDRIIGKRAQQAMQDEVDYRNAGGAVQIDLANQRATGEGNDTFVGINWAVGSQFGDTITGNGESNVLNGYLGNDHIDGGPGGDLLSGDGGDDTVNGGSGAGTGVLDQDYLVYTNAPGAVGVDFVAGKTTGWGNDTVSGIEGVFGSHFSDQLTGSDDNILWGREGDDELRAAGGVNFAAYGQPVDANLAQGRASAGSEGNDRLIGIAGVIGSSGSDKITGDAKANVLVGGPGGADAIDGGAGPDVLVSGGASTLLGGLGADRLDGGGASDQLDGGAGDDLLAGGGGDDAINGGDGVEDSVNYLGAAGVNVNLEQGTATGQGNDRLSNVEAVNGSSRDDQITGDGKANSLSGGDGNDTIGGGAGADFLDGGVGRNALDGGPGADYCRQKGKSCEVSGAPNIPGKAPLPPGVTPPRRAVKRVSPARVLQAVRRQHLSPALAALFPDAFALALSTELEPTRVQKGETAAFKYAAEPVCFATKPYRTEIAPPRTVSPVAGDGKPEEAWWQGTLYRQVGRKYKKFKTTAWARAALAGGATVPGVTLWKDVTGKRAFPNTVSVKAKKGRYVWKGNLYWVRSGGQVFQPIEPHIIRTATIRHNKQCVFR